MIVIKVSWLNEATTMEHNKIYSLCLGDFVTDEIRPVSVS